MLLWNGACHVHEKFSVEKIIELKQQYLMLKFWFILNVKERLLN
mgnify:CR=1 FL=1